MATATKSNIALRSPQGVASAVDRFLASMDWNGCGNYRRECVAHWTKLFATDEVVYTFNKITPPSPIKTGIERLLASMYCNCCDNYRRESVAHWTKLLPMRLFIPNPSFRTSFR